MLGCCLVLIRALFLSIFNGRSGRRAALTNISIRERQLAPHPTLVGIRAVALLSVPLNDDEQGMIVVINHAYTIYS